MSVRERIRVLDGSRTGYVAALTRVCNDVDIKMKNYANVENVRDLQSRLSSTWQRYRLCCNEYADLLNDKSCEKYRCVESQFQSQRVRIQLYHERINLFISSAVELEVTRLEMEIKQKEMEIQHTLELSKLETVSDVILAAKSSTEPTDREANCEPSELPCELFSELFSEHNVSFWEGYIIPPPPMFSEVPEPRLPKTSTPLQVLSFKSPGVAPPTMQCPVSYQLPSYFPEFQSEPTKCANDSVVIPQVLETPVAVPINNLYTNAQFVAPPPVNNTLTSESLLSTIVSTMDKISVSHDLPLVSVQRFDGSPEKYPAFRQRFNQLVERRALDDAVKMTRLLQFLEGPALSAVQRYEPVPGGLSKALKTLEDRFGRPYQVVRACIEAMTKGPAILANDKQGIQDYADTVQVSYDTLEAMGYLDEMNTDNLEKIMSRLPKWMQVKFVERLNRLEQGGQDMPNFKDVVEFLKTRADVINHPFFTKSQSEMVSSSTKPKFRVPTQRVTSFATTATRNESCPKCSKPHPLYRCDDFKLMTPQARSEFVRDKRICFNCICSTEHNSKTCKSLVRCRAPGCGKPHHTMLHFTEKRENVDWAHAPPIDQANHGSCSTTNSNSGCEILLQVVPLKVISDRGKTTTTFGLLDSGSDITLIDPSLARAMGMQGTPSKLSLSTVNERDKQEQGVKVEFKIAPVNGEGEQEIKVKSAWAVKELTIPLKHTKLSKSANQWPHLQGVPFPEVERNKISVLLGTNIQEAFIPLEVRKGKSNEPLAIKTCIGWSILGGTSNRQTDERFNLNHISGEDVNLERQVEEFWKSESYGTEKPEGKSMSVEDHEAVKTINKTICKQGNHYQMGLLWKDQNPRLPYNRVLAEARLQHLKKRLLRDPELLKRYRTVIDNCVKKGYARRLTEEESARVSDATWYLPHHPVCNPNKPDKVRVVFDAAAKFGGTSLNDNLLQGPALINDLSGVLIRFRQEEIAFTADVESMFYQVRVIDSDTEALRFLWWPDTLDDRPHEYKMLVHIFGAKSSPCCANTALRATAQDNEKDYDPEVIQSVRRNFYVDDVLKSVSTTEQAIKVATGLTKLLSKGGFRLTKFTSNSRDVLMSMPPEERSNPKLDMDLDKLPIERALGVYWDAQLDVFKFKVVHKQKPPTKRGILSVVSSLFDPLGFLAPFVLTMKILLQDLWRNKFLWDEELPEPYLSRWRNWVQSLPQVVTISIPRCYKSTELGTSTSLQLHHFSDASICGYSAVSYLRMTDEQGKIHCAFVMGKTRNVPMKEWSIPRLELQAAVLATRLHKIVVRELELKADETHFWTDSMTVLQYVKNRTRRFLPFVANRVTEIHEVTTPEQWHFVPGTLNPADEGSRGMNIKDFQPGCRWWSGATFLWETEDRWPNVQIGQLPCDDKEVKNESIVMSITTESQVDLLLRRFSSWEKLLRVTAYVLRFIKRTKKENVCYLSKIPTLSELQNSATEIIRLVQRQWFQEEYLALQKGHQVTRQSKLANLNPILVEGVLRVGGRVGRAPIAYSAVHPMILAKEHPVSKLIVIYYHNTLGHAGREHVLSAIRERYWIPRARSFIRQMLQKCISCRKRNAPVMQQMMGDLPRERLTPYLPPFTYTGVDYFGPFYVKRGRSCVKVYGCIFVCLNSRAIHIEDSSSLETDTFIQALRRFISVRGCPKEIWSDNGTNFTGAEKELRISIQNLNEETIKKELHSREVEWYVCPMPKWRFQPPTASHMSGVWERLIRSVRKTMTAILGNPSSALGYETLRTVFCEVTSILNGRPLCPSSEDPSDLGVITPNHLLLQRQNLDIPPGVFIDTDLYCRKQWRHAQVLANHFWMRWIREYIPTLQHRQKWLLKKRNLAVNDLVLVVNNTEPRCRWLLGRVTKVFPGKDAQVRTVEVRTRNSHLVRPITKLCLLEESS